MSELIKVSIANDKWFDIGDGGPGVFYPPGARSGTYFFGNRVSLNGQWRMMDIREAAYCTITRVAPTEYEIKVIRAAPTYTRIDRIYSPEEGGCMDENVMINRAEAPNSGRASKMDPGGFTPRMECESDGSGGYWEIGAGGGGGGGGTFEGGYQFHVEFCEMNAVYVDGVLIGVEEVSCWTEMM